MKKINFINDDFLLQNKSAIRLYHEFAENQPIIDYHCHLAPKQIADNHVFENLTRAWLDGDHYKWRAMRTCGIDEQYITGNASDKEKFMAWAKVVPQTLRNPLYHWSHLELKRYFDIDSLLNEKTASVIYEHASAQLNSASFSTQNLIKKMNVEVVCTTEDPLDTLQHHQSLKKQDLNVKVSTAFRPDKAIMIGNTNYQTYLEKLSQCSAVTINSFKTLCDALKIRIDYFHNNGCRLSDHGLRFLPYKEASTSELDAIFSKRMADETLSELESQKFQTAVLLFLCQEYHAKGWVQQFHLGALRNNNSRMNGLLGADTGWDSIGDFKQGQTLSKFLNALDGREKLTKTILYNLNPADNELFASMIGNFNDGSVKGKMQFGSGWWFLDQKDGITKQLNALSNMGLISCFIGMLTDSRSFLSYPRHEYFRRVLCNLLGQEMENGELPKDFNLVGNMIQDICYNNAKAYFNY